MAEQKSEENIIFLPWTVESQPQTQAVILQQPSETHLRLDATTDKTAIASFIIATIIALALGGLATWLAYWYGRKSFDLTKQSFDAVMAQIKSSEKSALDLNQRLFEQQKELLKIQIDTTKTEERIRDIRESASNFLASVNQFVLIAEVFEIEHMNEKLTVKKTSTTVAGQILLEMQKINDNAYLKLVKLQLCPDNTEDFRNITSMGYLICILINELTNEYFKKNKIDQLSVFKINENFPEHLKEAYRYEFEEEEGKRKLIVVVHLLIKFTQKIKEYLN